MKSTNNQASIEPIPDTNNSFSPSPKGIELAVPLKTDYDHTEYPNANKDGKSKVIVVCTEEQYMTMANGKKFSTGNHPVEMLVPMLHLEKAGFEFEIVTPTGKPVKIEMWAMPKEDEAVSQIYSKYKSRFENPIALSELVKDIESKKDEHVAAFIPGGHGAMLGLPEDTNLQKLIYQINNNNKYMLSICHGPAALLAANIDKGKEGFIYKGYKMAIFLDAVDKQTPAIGYLPGEMPWYFNEKLIELGCEIINDAVDGSCWIDRKLITGDSPTAANQFGKLAAETLLS